MSRWLSWLRAARVRRLFRLLGVALVSVLFLGVGGLTLLAASGHPAPVPQTPVSAFLAAGDPATATDVPLPTATDTPQPAPTATPVPPPPPPPPTATPVPAGVAVFTCGLTVSLVEPGVYMGSLCVAVTAGNVSVPFSAHYCPGQLDDSITVYVDASGRQTTHWNFHPICAAPFTVTLTAFNGFTGSASYTVQS